MRFTVFYGQQIYGQYLDMARYLEASPEFPIDVIVFDNADPLLPWTSSVFSKIEDEDVPPYLKHLQLVLGL